MTQQKTGWCALCEQTIGTARMTKHIGACIRQTMGVKQDAEHHAGSAETGVTHLRVLSQEPDSDHYLQLLARVDSPLEAIDQMVRKLWAEPCCGIRHASWLTRGETTIRSDGPTTEPGMQATVRYLWAQSGSPPEYGIDPGLPIYCRIDEFGVYEHPQEEAVRLIARNDPPERSCASCGAPASWATGYRSVRSLKTRASYQCGECATSNQGGTLLPLTNSPRSGFCSYGVPDRN